MPNFSADYFIHAANILLLVAYSVRDILWLRLFAVGASVVSIPYFLLQPTRLWAPLGWTVVFAGINLLQSWRLFMERQPVKLTAEEEEVRRLVCGWAGLSPPFGLRLCHARSRTGSRALESLVAHDRIPRGATSGGAG